MTEDFKQSIEKARDLLFEAQKLVISSFNNELVRLGEKKPFPRKSEFYDERFDTYYSLNSVAFLLDDLLRYIDHRLLSE